MSTSRKRLSPADREKQILTEAIRFFADQGFDGQTRQLADRIGITQPLLYRYFASKEQLIERVYQEVYVGRWKPEWEELLRDRDIPLEERLLAFYQQYARVVDNREWIRILILAGMKKEELTRRYLSLIRTKLILPICVELRVSLGLPEVGAEDLTPPEIELVWAFHGTFFYRSVRRWVYEMPVEADIDTMVKESVTTFLTGASTTIPRIVGGA
ncbi:TetR/AcrR family transcriptional regulator [Telmatospirillum sp. J64-1]|uniref:TetR/AcrR family transcriptional regulator n=1 Tax=Telmatospirillum sp. J64-1 TaxID=2502183 RepID=UPI00115D9B02|nr:TetR/AcrR family transcriptional regulator [Telmatospirillum sp. J64-1]